MKLILNGGGEGNQVKSARELLNSLIDHSKKILYIPLAWVDSNYDSCLEFMTNELSDVDCIGIEMVKSGEEIVNKNLSDYACIYIGGGNTYKLLSELKTSGAFDKIRDYLINEDGIVYGGSAGAIIFGKDLDSCNTDDDNEVGLIDNTGFDMINGYSLLCHYTSRDSERTELSRKYLLELSKTKPVYAIPEEDTIFIDNGFIHVIGSKDYYLFKDGVENTMYITPTIETERLILKHGKYEDYVKVYEYDFTRLRNIGGEFEYIKYDPQKLKGWENCCIEEEKTIDFIVYLKDTMQPIANLLYDRYNPENKSLEISVNLHPSYWRKGYMTEAILESMKYVFTNMDIDNIVYGYAEENFKSKGLSDKIGFAYYSFHVEHYSRIDKDVKTINTIMSKEKFFELYEKKSITR